MDGGGRGGMGREGEMGMGICIGYGVSKGCGLGLCNFWRVSEGMGERQKEVSG
jgi:hypothetical protein